MDISIEIENIKFNYRVAGVIKNKNNILLHKNDDDIFHAIPGGRIKIGETSKEALKREFIEEMGLTPKKLKFRGIIENFFEYNNKKYHEVMIIYDVEFDPDCEIYKKDVIKGIEEKSKLNFVWKTLDEIENLDLRPKSLKDILVHNEEECFDITEID